MRSKERIIFCMEYELQINTKDGWRRVYGSDSVIVCRNNAANLCAEYRISDGLRVRSVVVNADRCNTMGPWRRLESARRGRAAAVRRLMREGYPKSTAIAIANEENLHG